MNPSPAFPERRTGSLSEPRKPSKFFQNSATRTAWIPDVAEHGTCFVGADFGSAPGLSILGVGCVTALGRDWETVWGSICAGERPEWEAMHGPDCSGPVGVFKTAIPDIPPAASARLRRSGSISYFACAAAADAVQQAGPLPARTALVFATSDGSVSYTRRFFEEIVTRGTGSPLLFPETVYNAPASHVAAMLGLDGVVLTLVNDATAGMDALSTASDIIHSGDADRCLVVAAEELDWITCEGYRRWKMTTSVAGANHGAVLSEGAVALVLGPASSAGVQIARVHPGRGLRRHSAAMRTMRNVIEELAEGTTPDLAVLSSSAAGSGGIEELLVKECFPRARRLAPKCFAGEAFAVSSLLQCLCAWQELKRPGTAIVPVLGWSGQVGGALLTSERSQDSSG